MIGNRRIFVQILRVSNSLPTCLPVSIILHCGLTAFFNFIVLASVIDRLMNTGLRIRDACPLQFWRTFNYAFSMFCAFFMFCSSFLVFHTTIFKLPSIFSDGILPSQFMYTEHLIFGFAEPKYGCFFNAVGFFLIVSFSLICFCD